MTLSTVSGLFVIHAAVWTLFKQRSQATQAPMQHMPRSAYLKVDPVELIKASPCPAGGKTLEEFSHCNVVQGVTACNTSMLVCLFVRQPVAA